MESPGKIGISVEKTPEKLDRRISVAPMMDWIDDPETYLQIRCLQTAGDACLLYVSSAPYGIHAFGVVTLDIALSRWRAVLPGVPHVLVCATASLGRPTSKRGSPASARPCRGSRDGARYLSFGARALASAKNSAVSDRRVVGTKVLGGSTRCYRSELPY